MGTMRYILVLLTAPLLMAQTTPKATGILNGASFTPNLCPGALASLFGTNLATSTTQAESLPLPTDLLGTKGAGKKLTVPIANWPMFVLPQLAP